MGMKPGRAECGPWHFLRPLSKQACAPQKWLLAWAEPAEGVAHQRKDSRVEEGANWRQKMTQMPCRPGILCPTSGAETKGREYLLSRNVAKAGRVKEEM